MPGVAPAVVALESECAIEQAISQVLQPMHFSVSLCTKGLNLSGIKVHAPWQGCPSATLMVTPVFLRNCLRESPAELIRSWRPLQPISTDLLSHCSSIVSALEHEFAADPPFLSGQNTNMPILIKDSEKTSC